MNPLTRIRHRHQLRNWLDMMQSANTLKREDRRLCRLMTADLLTDAHTSTPIVLPTLAYFEPQRPALITQEDILTAIAKLEASPSPWDGATTLNLETGELGYDTPH
jgi:hypothetical protein